MKTTTRPRIKLTNDFHRTEAVIIPQPITDGRFRGRHYITRKTMLRVRRALCGVPTCCCGGTFGERNWIDMEIVTEDYDRNLIVDVLS